MLSPLRWMDEVLEEGRDWRRAGVDRADGGTPHRLTDLWRGRGTSEGETEISQLHLHFKPPSSSDRLFNGVGHETEGHLSEI